MERELSKLKICLNLYETFFCAFIVLDDTEKIIELKKSLEDKVNFIADCHTIQNLVEVKNRVMAGEKIILYNLDELYNQFATYDTYYNGVFHFYQRFTESYRDKLWKNATGQLYFVLTNNQLEQYYEKEYGRHNHFSTMCMATFDFNKYKVKEK